MVVVKLEFEDFDDVQEYLWGQGERTWRNVRTSAERAGNPGICDDVFEYVSELFGSGDMTLTELNDYIAFQLSDDYVERYSEDGDTEMAEIAGLW